MGSSSRLFEMVEASPLNTADIVVISAVTSLEGEGTLAGAVSLCFSSSSEKSPIIACACDVVTAGLSGNFRGLLKSPSDCSLCGLLLTASLSD